MHLQMHTHMYMLIFLLQTLRVSLTLLEVLKSTESFLQTINCQTNPIDWVQ